MLAFVLFVIDRGIGDLFPGRTIMPFPLATALMAVWCAGLWVYHQIDVRVWKHTLARLPPARPRVCQGCAGTNLKPLSDQLREPILRCPGCRSPGLTQTETWIT